MYNNLNTIMYMIICRQKYIKFKKLSSFEKNLHFK